MVTNTLFSPARARPATAHRSLPDAGSPGAPHSVWIAPPRAIKSPLASGTELPLWAFEAACGEYAPHGGAIAVMAGPAAFLATGHLAPLALAPGWLHAAEEVELPAPDVEPVALAVVLDDPPDELGVETCQRADWYHQRAARFYREVHDALAPGGIALVHTHTLPTDHGLHDPAAVIIRAAQAAGLGYLQHVVIVHTRLDAPTTPRYRAPAQQPVSPVCRRVHSDLYVLAKEGERR
jgi:SAM-dependent methyltransferase